MNAWFVALLSTIGLFGFAQLFGFYATTILLLVALIVVGVILYYITVADVEPDKQD